MALDRESIRWMQIISGLSCLKINFSFLPDINAFLTFKMLNQGWHFCQHSLAYLSQLVWMGPQEAVQPLCD